ncbi:MAG: protoporphyrinogen oxidase HemJ [Alphaproteobacteria bacterium]|nr:protoporphyrinogen oxidase HemJ [Alphaproteobacteria bacterium]MBU0798908.1 protoporphyrinogen oxidase HemJ [Alphaproteobacteria bacterium]MBU0886296.1 protoporphyrinogen oxidase HemJ [Alphaproteobacteria bacterium]MBU1813508.1 protoporphyrinogen oxidase HemJ [Alphaproteobacteria bacterium]
MGGDLYSWIKALHLISVIAWMAGMLYLPRLYVYHAGVAAGSPESEVFKVMERRLLRAIINPAMGATFIFGIWLLVLYGPDIWSQGWWHAKLTFVILMTAAHGFLSRWRKDFEADRNTRSTVFYRVANEVPTVLMIVIVVMVIVKPF